MSQLVNNLERENANLRRQLKEMKDDTKILNWIETRAGVILNRDFISSCPSLRASVRTIMAALKEYG